MVKQVITMTDGGFDAWIEELDRAAEEIPQIMLESLKARQKVIEEAIKAEWVGMGGSPGGFVYSSVGQSAMFSKINPMDVVGTTGVYDINSVKMSFGRDKPIKRKNGKYYTPLNAAQLAYWTEYGASRLRYGGRKIKGLEYPDDMLVTTQPRPFISQAAYKSWDNAEKAFRERFNEEYQRLVK